ncbi:MAG: glycosyltransferase family 4 protein [Paracoccaceae bacterium]
MKYQSKAIATDQIEVIAPNLKRRLSGVTATIVRLVPILSKQIKIVATGPGLPVSMPHISLWRLPFLPSKMRKVWHARRNSEMLLGLLLKKICRRNLALLFTSASQRKHTRFTKFLISNMDAIIATSQKTAGYLERPATVIHHGIDTHSFAPARNIDALRKKLGLPIGLLIGCYGRIRHQKGTDLFVDALLDLLPRHPDFHGIVMGRATKAHTDFLIELQSKTARAGLSDRLDFLPEVGVDQVADWYKVLDLFVAPQRWEGFGLTPLEAMACGVPVVASRVGAFEEQILENETGLIVERDDATAICCAIEAITKDRESLATKGVAARTNVDKNFRIEDEATEIISVYRSLLMSRG